MTSSQELRQLMEVTCFHAWTAWTFKTVLMVIAVINVVELCRNVIGENVIPGVRLLTNLYYSSLFSRFERYVLDALNIC